MSNDIIFRPPSDLSDPPLPPEIVARILAHRFGLKRERAAVVAELAGLGARRATR